MPLDIFIRFEPKPGKHHRLLQELMRVLPPTRDEPGCIRIHLYESTLEPLTYFIHSEWIDDRAFDAHAQLPHTQRLRGHLDELMANPFEAVRTKQID